MHGGDVLLVVLILVFGCAAFLFGVMYVVIRGVGYVVRSVMGLIRANPRGRSHEPKSAGRAARVCPREQCRRVEHRASARYCSQCGMPLS